MDDRPPPLSARAWFSRLLVLLLGLGAADVVFELFRDGVMEIAFGLTGVLSCGLCWHQPSKRRPLALCAASALMALVGVLKLTAFVRRSVFEAILMMVLYLAFGVAAHFAWRGARSVPDPVS